MASGGDNREAEKDTLFQQENRDELTVADFESAIVAAKWGKFHWIVYAIAITSGWSSMFETTTMSYVFPAAECDLDLKLEHKGLLNAVTYAGMISTGFIWGYLCDTLGRKKLLVIGYFLDGLFVLSSASSQSFATLMVSKFLGGVIINGPFSAITTYLSELHCAKQRGRVQFVLGVIYSFGVLLLPILAVEVLPLRIDWRIGDGFVVHSWNVYLLICAIVPFVSGAAFCFLPESPKFLMTTGQNEKALKIFRKIYRLNTGESEDSYPVKVLVDEIELNAGNKFGKVTAKRTKSKAFLEGFQQMRPLLHAPYLAKIILICVIQCCTLNSLNTLRLWLPQLFQAVNDYEQTHNDSVALCDALAVFHPNKTAQAAPTECVVNTNNISVYTNSMIVCAVSILAYVVAGSIVNKIGRKRLYISLSLTSCLSVLSLVLSRNTATMLTLASIFVATGSVMINCMLAITVDMFPTTLRTMAVALAMMCGRMGATVGNALYPALLETGCAPPFIYNGLLSLSCALLGLLLPVTDFSALT